MTILAKTQRKHLYTPLRYPGGKTSLYEFFDSVIDYNELEKVKYIEPYAGGAGAALSLLILGKVDSIVINDFDVAIYSFWKSILDHPDEFIDKINNTPINIDEWYKQREIYKSKNSDVLTLGFATFFLNRTNRSGILKGGVIGGKAQTGKWKLDARFNKIALIQKIRLIQKFRKQITIHNLDGLELIELYKDNPESLFYIDPPYYVQGGSLYLNSYKHDAHEKLAELLNLNAKTIKWMLTYDNVQPILDLYNKRENQEPFILNYQANSTKKGSEIMIFSDCLAIPRN